MQETEAHESVGTDVTESGAKANGEIEVNRSAEEYAKKLSEVSKENEKRRKREGELKRSLDELQTRLKEIEESKALEQGQFKEAWEKTKKELETEKEARRKEKVSYAQSVVTSQIMGSLSAAGCTNPTRVYNLMKTEGFLNEVDLDESTYQLSSESLKGVMEKALKEIPEYFGKTAPLVKDGTPKTLSTKVSLSEIPLAKRLEMIGQEIVSGGFQTKEPK